MNTTKRDLEMRLKYREDPGDDAGAEKNRKAVMDALDAVAEGDMESFWSLFDEDVVFHEAACLPYGGAHMGREATIRAHNRLAGMYSKMRNEIEAVLAARDIVVLYQTITFTVKSNGNTGSMPIAEMLRFRSGKVVEWRALYFDSNMVANTLAGVC
jgi:ketosteroid isomerase-like protein